MRPNIDLNNTAMHNFNSLDTYNNTIRMKRTTRKEENMDMTKLSDQSQEFNKVLFALNNVPNVREDKINEIKNRIENDTYNISSKDLANKILDYLL